VDLRRWMAGPTKTRCMEVRFAKVAGGWTYKNERGRVWIVKVWVAASLKNEGRRWPSLQKWGWQDSPLPKLRAEGPRVARKRAGEVTFSK